MVVLMCWEMRTTICLGFVPRKRFIWYKICLVRHLVPIERFKRYGISLLWQMVPIERFRRNIMVFAFRLVLFERISGTNPFTRVIPYRLNVLSSTKWCFSYVLSRLNVLNGTNPSIVDIPYRSSVLNGTEWFSMTFCSTKTFHGTELVSIGKWFRLNVLSDTK